MGILIICVFVALLCYVIYRIADYNVGEVAIILGICACALAIIIIITSALCYAGRPITEAKLAIEYQTLVQNRDNPFALEAITNWNSKVAAGQAFQKNWLASWLITADWSKFQLIM